MGLLSNLLEDDSGERAAGSVSDMEKALASDRWITIHPHGFLQGEGEDETKQYYRRIFIDDDGNIEKGIGAGHNVKDLSKVMKDQRKGGQEIGDKVKQVKTKKSEEEIKEENKKRENEIKNNIFIKNVQDTLVKDDRTKARFDKIKEQALETLNKYGTDPRDREFIKKEIIYNVNNDLWNNLNYNPMNDLTNHLKSVETEEAWNERKSKFDKDVEETKKQLNELKEKLNSFDIKDRRKSKYLNQIEMYMNDLGKTAYNAHGIGLCRANIDKYEDFFKSQKEVMNRDLFRLANKWMRENEYLNYKISDEEKQASEDLAKRREERVEGMRERAEEIKTAGRERFNKGWKELEAIPLGQPNIEGRLNPVFKRIDNSLRIGNEEIKRGERLERRAEGAEQALSNLRSDDPAIIPKLQEAIKNSSNSAERQRLRDRLDTAIRTHERNKNGGGLNMKTDLYDLEENVQDGRIRFKFSGVPSSEVRNVLKSHGFRWSPSNKAWQRQNTPNGVYSTKRVIEELKKYS